ncbi:MAG: hypothetical protein AB1351_00230 [Thermoproteota archaeon]
MFEAELSSIVGRGKLRITYNWLYSALNCDPNDNSSFTWVFIKRDDGKIVISPKNGYLGKTLYASVRDDWGWYVQVQAPNSADWITAVGRDEILEIAGTGILSIALKGFNGRFIAVNQTADNHGGHAGYRLRSVDNMLVDDCGFVASNVNVLQPGITFLEGYTVKEDDISAVLDAYGLTLTNDEITELKNRFPQITPQLLAKPPQMVRTPAKDGIPGAVVGGVTGGIIGGVIGFMIGGPLGAVAGVGIGMAAGANIGMGLEIHQPHEDPTNVVNPGIPDIARTQVNITPAGGPYSNSHLWEDLFRFTKFPQIGDPSLPYAGCLYPPASNGSGQVWLPTNSSVNPLIYDAAKWGSLPSPAGAVYMSIYVIVEIQNGKYQLRLHPDHPLLNGPDRPNHSQLTQGSRILALIGYDTMDVYAAGELYYTQDRMLKGINAKTGHYFNWTPTFDSEVFDTTKRMLQALGYNASSVLTGDDFWNWMRGY